MYSVSAGFVTAAQTTSHTVTPKLEWLDANLNVLQDLSAELLSGSVTVENGLEGRRGFQMTLKNAGGIWTPTGSPSTEPFFMHNIIRISLGIVVGGSYEYCPLGTFHVNKVHADPSARVVEIDGQDFWKRFSWGLRSTVRFAPGTTLNAMILALAGAAGITNVSLDPLGDAVGLQASPAPSLKFRSGTKVGDCFAVLAGDFGWEFPFDVNGTLVTRPSLAIDQQTSVLTLSDTDPCYQYARGGFEDSPDMFNHVGVSSTDPALPPVFGEAMDDNPLSPTYFAGSFGDRYHEEEFDWVQNSGQATQAAQRILRDNLFLARPVEVVTSALPFLDAQDVLTFTDADLKITAGRFLVDSIEVPLDGGDQTMRLLEARAIGL